MRFKYDSNFTYSNTKGAPEVSDAEYLERIKLRSVVAPNGCWEYQGAINKEGYGDMGYRGKTLKVHKIAYMCAIGPIPPGMVVCHECDNRRCCNPDHLWLGTRADNNKDMYAKGRGKYQPNRYTKCKNGHEYTPETMRYTKDGFRQCKVCELIRNRLRAGWPKDLAESTPRVPSGYQVVANCERVSYRPEKKELTRDQLRQQRYRVRRKERLAKTALVE